MHAFEYAAPASVADAAAALANEDAKVLAGGQTLLPTMKQRLAAPSVLVDLRKIDGLSGISREGDALVIGAMTRHAEVAASKVVQGAIPGLAALAALIGDPAVRHRGTIGGSLANNDPAADYPAAALALGATIVTNKREIAAGDFFKGLFETALEPGELLTAVEFPIPELAAYLKFPQPASRFALVGVFVSRAGARARVAVTGAGACAFRVSQMEAALARAFTPEALRGITVAAEGLNGDLHGSAEYRAHLIAVLAGRAIAQALA